ncbi:VENN motif pre-toxin domain-containing protein [Serratia nevei]|uniref:VENN motif pre-toxin domain-containing protein n=1 Tax=Serratia nevei TaxID=2703794 RepID=UPI00368CCFBF
MKQAYDNAIRQYGTGSDLQKAAQAVTGALTALAGNNLAGALASGASPYLATEIKKRVGEDNIAANAMAHAVLGAVTAQLNNQSAAAGGLGAGGGELTARYIAGQLFPGKTAEQLSESEKQQVSALSQLAAGLAGGLATGDTAGAVTGGQAGKNAVENNHLSLPNGLMDAGRATSTLSKFMTEHGATPEEVTQAQSGLAKGLGTGAPQPATELVKKWALLMSTAATMGTGSAVGVGAAATGGAIGGAANVSTQLTVNGDKPFSYTDALIAIGTGALTQGKGPLLTGGVSVGGAYVGSTIKGEDPTNAMIGAGVGSAAGIGAGKVVTDKLKPIISDGSAELIGAGTGAITSELTGSKTQEKLDGK